jgi:hypothetical protein
MEIIFTHHAIEKKTERADWLVRTEHYGETRRKKAELEELLRTKGEWYEREGKDGITRYYCIVNKLEVYCGIYLDDEDIILITTYYPYTSKMRKRLFPKKRQSFERYHLPEEE